MIVASANCCTTGCAEWLRQTLSRFVHPALDEPKEVSMPNDHRLGPCRDLQHDAQVDQGH